MLRRRHLWALIPATAAAWSSVSTRSSTPLHHHSTTSLHAKRNKRQTSRQDAEDLDRWYENVQADASPDDVFWSEYERQPPLILDATPATTSSANFKLDRANAVVALEARGNLQTTEATLSEYGAFAVHDNWLDEEISWMMQDDVYADEEGGPTLDEQLEDWERAQDNQEDDDGDDEDEEDNAWMQSDDPWDQFGVSDNEVEQQERIRQSMSHKADEFLLTYDDDDSTDDAETLARLAKLQIRSRRLERARGNPKA